MCKCDSEILGGISSTTATTENEQTPLERAPALTPPSSCEGSCEDGKIKPEEELVLTNNEPIQQEALNEPTRLSI